METTLQKRAQETIRRGLGWLRRHERRAAAVQDLAAHYKAPYLYAVVGDPIRGRRYADWMQDRYLQPSGDFSTWPAAKGWAHLPCSPFNRYLYSNGWIIAGLRKLGFYGAAAAGIGFVRGLQAPDLGGFYSHYDPALGRADSIYLDSSSTSSAGLALLACGHIEAAGRAGDFILRMLEAQPAPDRHFYCSWERGSGLMTDVWGDEDPNALRGRKQFCLTAEADPRHEYTWLIGKPCKFLAKLYDATAERRYLEGAEALFGFFHRLDEGRWFNYASCKVMWSAAELYRLTGQTRFATTAEQILDWFCESQDPSGLWVHGLLYQRPEEQPFVGSLDIVQELTAEISDTLFELSAATFTPARQQ